MRKKLLLSIISLLGVIQAWSYDVVVDGIYYNLNEETNEAEVTFESTSYESYSGEVTIPASILYSDIAYNVTSIGKKAFLRCSELLSIDIPNSVTAIGRAAFDQCTGLTSVDIPNNISFIDEYVFYGCSNLESIKIPNSVTSIGDFAFSGCSSLTEVTIPGNITSIGERAFYNCNELTSIEIPGGDIGAYAFSYCNNLSHIRIMSYCDIKGGAFSYCKNLTCIEVYSERPPYMPIDAFQGGSRDNAILYVPMGLARAQYMTDASWCNFTDIRMMKDDISITSAGIATYCYDHDLDFSEVSGLSAYIVSGFSPSTGTLTLTPVTKVPAGEGLLLKGDEGSYEVPFTTTDMYYSNLLKGVTTATEIDPTDGDNTNFILADGIHGINFYTVSETGELAAGKAYLHLPTSAVSALSRGFKLVFDDETTGISEKLKTDAETFTSGQMYDLQGRHVVRPAKGIYIVKGKKVIIK